MKTCKGNGSNNQKDPQTNRETNFGKVLMGSPTILKCIEVQKLKASSEY